jgi:hypothetical protein
MVEISDVRHRLRFDADWKTDLVLVAELRAEPRYRMSPGGLMASTTPSQLGICMYCYLELSIHP